MLGKAPPTTSSLNLVKLDLDSATSDEPDVKIAMADLVESLDTRELDFDEGEETDYDGSALGELSKYHGDPKLVELDNKCQSKWRTNGGKLIFRCVILKSN